MSGEMIERVAKAIDKESSYVAFSPYTLNKMAKAAIQAMRKPTEEMLCEATAGYGNKDIWERMIDAALSEDVT